MVVFKLDVFAVVRQTIAFVSMSVLAFYLSFCFGFFDIVSCCSGPSHFLSTVESGSMMALLVCVCHAVRTGLSLSAGVRFFRPSSGGCFLVTFLCPPACLCSVGWMLCWS